MVKCPECKNEIEDLRYSTKINSYGVLFVDDKGNSDYDTKDFGDWEDTEFACPRCNKVLFVDSSEAEEFLKKDNRKNE